MCPGGALDKEGIMAMYLMPRDKAKVFIDEMFRMFDADGNGTVSFKVSFSDIYVLAQKLETFKTCKLFSLIVLKNEQCIWLLQKLYILSNTKDFKKLSRNFKL